MAARQKPAAEPAKDQDGPQWDEQVAVAGRPQDEPAPNTTFADRAAARQPKGKAVQAAENKAVEAAESK